MEVSLPRYQVASFQVVEVSFQEYFEEVPLAFPLMAVLEQEALVAS